MAEADYLKVSTGQLITSSINTFTISSGTIYARTLSTANLYADYIKGDGSQLSNVPFTPQAYSIPWNAMQPYGGLLIQSGDWRLDDVTASNINSSSLTTKHGKIASLTSRVICTFFMSTNSMKSIYNEFDIQTGGVQLVESSLMTYLSTGRLDVGFTNINLITSKYGKFSSISTGVWNAGNIQFSSLSLFDNELQINNVITMSSGVLLLNNNNYLSNTIAISNLVSTTTNLQFSLLFTSNVLNTKEVNDFNTSKIAFSTLSTVSGSNLSTTNTNIISSLTGLASLGYVSSTQLTSSIIGLGTYYVSTPSLMSSLTGLGTLGYVSTASLTSTVTGLGTYYVSTPSLTSSLTGLGTLGYVSTASLTSSLTGLGTLGYVSTASLISTVTGLGTYYVSTLRVTPSSLTGLGTLGYISTSYLHSTITGLGSLGYVSTSGTSSDYINSTVTGLGSLGYVSTSQLTSTVTGLGSYYVSTLSVTPSSLEGLGSLGYVSTSQLTSTVTGLGSYYVSTLSVTPSSLEGLGSLGYVSTSQLTSTVTGLGSYYVSTLLVTPSSLTGLGSLGYVSTSQLISTVTGLGSYYVSTTLNTAQISSFIVSTLALSTFSLFTQGPSSLVITNSNLGNFIVSSMNLGVNCNAPDYMLDVNGNANINKTLRVAGLTTLANTSNTGTLGLAGLTVTSSNLGLFTNSFFAQFEIRGGANLDGNFGSNLISFQYGTDGGYRHFITTRHYGYANSPYNSINFWLNNTTTPEGSSTNGVGNVNTMSITATGVGINCNAPTRALDVFGSINFSGSLYSNGTLFTSSTDVPGINSTGNVGINSASNTSNALLVTGSQSNTGALFIGGSATFVNSSNTGTLGVAGTATFVNSSNTGTLGVAGTATFVNSSNTGTLGVAGTATFVNSSNTGTLGVAGTLGVTGLATFVNSSNTGTLGVAGEATFVNSSNTGTLGVAGLATFVNSSNTGTLNIGGNVGIGSIADPSYKLDVNGPMQAAIYYSTITIGGIQTIQLRVFGVFYNMTTSGTYTLDFLPSQPSSNIGKYICLRNNSGSTLSLTLTGVSGIASPVTLSNAQSATFVVATTTTYALF